jgi:hypothetical protein
MSAVATTDSRSLVRLVAAHGLTVAAEAPITLVDEAFAGLLERAVDERVTGWLLEAGTGTFAFSPEQQAAADAAHEACLAADLVLERLLRDTSVRFAAAGIEHRALKGPVVARTAYRSPALRSFRDIDVLVAGADFDRAVELLTETGGRARFREPRRHFTSRFGKGVCVTTADGLEIDLHRVFVAGPFGLAIDARDLFARSESVDVGGVRVPALGATEQFLHACYHAALGDLEPRMTALRDVGELARSPRTDVDDVLRVAQSWHGRAVVQHALQCTRRVLAPATDGPLDEWAERYRPDRFEQAALRVYRSPNAGYAAKAATGMWAINGYRARLAYASALLVPSRAYVHERDGGYGRRFRRGVRLVRQWKPTP